MEFKQQWDLAMALEVLHNRTVDSELWAEAVKWLLLFGSPEIKEVLVYASSVSTSSCFPELKPSGYSCDGQPCYDINALAASLGFTPEEVMEKLLEMERELGVKHLFHDSETNTIQ